MQIQIFVKKKKEKKVKSKKRKKYIYSTRVITTKFTVIRCCFLIKSLTL